MTTILQIVPRRAVIPDGIGDFASRLADRLADGHGIASVFLQAASGSEAEPRVDRWPTEALERRTGDALAEALARLSASANLKALLLHVSGYGYQRRGVPEWLAEGLEDFARSPNRVPVIGFFHELWVDRSARPWTSSFWLRSRQRRVTQRLWALCNRAITSNTAYRDMLGTLAAAPQNRHIDVLPVFSNIGEPETLLPFAERPAALAVFAGSGTAYLQRHHGKALRELLVRENIGEIVNIGARSESQPAAIGDVPVRALGQLPALAVSAVLAKARFGALCYRNRGVFGKSGTLAAYAAHGVVPVVFGSHGADADGLAAGRNYFVAGGGGVADVANISKRVREWYGHHNIARHAELLAGMLHNASRRAA